MAWAKTVAIGASVILAGAGPVGLVACAHADSARAPAEKKEKKAPEPKPAPFCASMDRIGLLAATAPGRVAITGETTSITLLPACGPPFLGQRVSASTAKRFVLLMDDVQTSKPLGAALGAAFAEAGPDQLTNDASTVGTLTLGAGSKAAPRRLSFDVTKIVRAMSEANHFEHIVIVVKPSPAPAAALSIGKVQIVEE